MLSTDHDFAAFLASRDLRRLVLEKPVPDFRTLRTRDYDAKTVWCMGVLHPVHVPDVHDVHDVHDAPVAVVAIIAPTPIPRPQFTFTDTQMAIAMAVQARQTLKEAS